ncbi:hypothetical protein HK405_012042, partial [Cladochytrium tenue]
MVQTERRLAVSLPPTPSPSGDEAHHTSAAAAAEPHRLVGILSVPSSSPAASDLAAVPEYGAIPDGHGLPVSIFCHSSWAHKNFSFFPALASDWPHASFRYDFYGSGESSGATGDCDHWRDVEHLALLCRAFAEKNWKVDTLLGHSRGTAVVMMFAATHPHIPRFLVNVAGRFNFVSGYPVALAEHIDAIRERGEYVTKVRRRGEVADVIVPASEDLWARIEDAVSQGSCTPLPASDVRHLPRFVPVLTVHGTHDERVPVSDAGDFATAIPNHTLQLLPGARHLFTDATDAARLVPAVCAWRKDQDTSLGRFYLAWERCPPTPLDLADALASPTSAVAAAPAQSMVTPWPLRIVKVGGVKNFRDFGGYPVGNGQWVRSGLLFRSA